MQDASTTHKLMQTGVKRASCCVLRDSRRNTKHAIRLPVTKADRQLLCIEKANLNQYNLKVSTKSNQLDRNAENMLFVYALGKIISNHLHIFKDRISLTTYQTYHPFGE